jgi:hypothetical protein
MNNENLKPFKPGQSGNPKGRPKGAKDGLMATIRRLGKKRPAEEVIKILESKGFVMDECTNNEVVAYSLFINAAEGDNQAANICLKADEESRRFVNEHTGTIAHEHQGVSRTLEILGEFRGSRSSELPKEPLPN